MNKPSRRLVVMRHAKAEQTGPTDAERELAPRGLTEATEAGQWLASQDFVPDHALVSGATRTRQTWTAMAEAAGWDLAADVDDALYAAGPESALDLIRQVPPGAQAVVVVGHNPTIAYLAQLLSDGTGDPLLLRDMTLGFPPASLSVLELDQEWADLDVASARLVGFRAGRG